METITKLIHQEVIEQSNNPLIKELEDRFVSDILILYSTFDSNFWKLLPKVLDPNTNHDNLIIILRSYGGDYFNDYLDKTLIVFFYDIYKYKNVSCLVTEFAKSSSALLALSGIELFFLDKTCGLGTIDPRDKENDYKSAFERFSYDKDLVLTNVTFTIKNNTETFYKRTENVLGGKKHLYHEYGTLMSDVWRDISIDYYKDIKPVVDRLQDLFGLVPYKFLHHIDLRKEILVDSQGAEKILIKEDKTIINKFTDNNSVIINGDCLEELTRIPSNSIDFCFADPPYNLNKKYEKWDDDIDIKKYFEWCDKWLSELGRIIKPGRTVAVLNIPQWTIRYFKHLSSILQFQDWIIWKALGLPVRMIMPSHYSILCFTKGESRELPGLVRNEHSELEHNSIHTYKEFFCTRASCINERRKSNIEDNELISNIWWDIHRLKHNSKRVDHPTQLPPLFMHRLISLFTNKNEYVLDPFNGAGTTSLCAGQLNRKYIGIELSEYYYSISLQRHQDLKDGKDPFGKQKKIPKAKNSYVRRLEKQKYEVDKKTLQLEVKEIAKKLGKIPSRDDVMKYSSYPIEYFDNYFINWSEVTAAARTTGMANVESKKNYEVHQQLRIFEEKMKNYKKAIP